MTRWLAETIAQHPTHALLAALATALLSFLIIPAAILCAAIIATITLTYNTRTAAMLLLMTGVVIAVSAPFMPSRPGLEIPVALLLLAPTALCAKVLDLSRSLALTITLATLLAWLGALAIQLISGDATAWWQVWLEQALAGVPDASMDGFRAEGILPIFNGLVATLFGLAVSAAVLLGRWLQTLAAKPGRFAGEFQQLRLTRMLPVVMSLILAVSYLFTESLFGQFLLIFLLPFYFQGLAVLHATVGEHPRKAVLLMPPYLLLIFIPQFVYTGMALAGLSDLFFNFRKIMPPPPAS
ncbi:MAG: hypothetical protein RQ715_02030 [Methylococcales bacterium]|nr:hypothetical protein [Methylococcales bacterium]